MKNIVIILFLTSSVTLLYGQTKTYLGLEGGLSHDKVEFTDNGNQLRSTPLRSWSGGMTLSHDISKYFTLETGLLIKEYQKGYAFDIIGGPGGITSIGLNTMQIPLRFKSRVPLIADKLFFTTTVGYHFCFNKIDHTGSLIFSTSGSGPRMESREDFTGDLQKSFGLLETAIGLELRVFKSAWLTFSAGYFTGFKKVTQGDIRYTVNDGPETRATMYSKGDYASFNMGLKLPINKFWPFDRPTPKSP